MLVVQLHKEDMDAIKNAPLLAVDAGSTHLSFQARPPLCFSF